MGQALTTSTAQIRPPSQIQVHPAQGQRVRPSAAQKKKTTQQQQQASNKAGGGRTSYVDIREHLTTAQLHVRSFTWHRDSHGLFDYESKTVTQNFIKCNYSTILHRFENEILFEEMHGELYQNDSTNQSMAALIYEKEGNYWVYHRAQVEDDEEEKLRPAEKAWLVVRFVNPMPNYQGQYRGGYKIRIGDTVKFGRVRFKVIMLSNDVDGELVFKESRFKTKKNNKKVKQKLSSLGNTNSEDDGNEEEEQHDDLIEGEEEELEDHDDMEDDDDEEEDAASRDPQRFTNPLINGEEHLQMMSSGRIGSHMHLGSIVDTNLVERMHSQNPMGLREEGSFLREDDRGLSIPRGRTTNFPENNNDSVSQVQPSSTNNHNSRRHNRRKHNISPSAYNGKPVLRPKKSLVEDNGVPICRICLCEEEPKPMSNPLISPCKCDGTMKYIHIECLREWLNSKSSFKESNPPGVKTYCWKALECELCKVRFPDRIASPDNKDSIINLINFEKPESDYLVLESVTQQNIKIIHVIDMNSNDYIKVGRGHDSQVRVTDISVSRFHALFKKSLEGDFILEDNNSKFGTLVLVRRPYLLQKHPAYFQLGRTMLECSVKEPYKCCNFRGLCFSKKIKATHSHHSRKHIAFDGENFYPEEFLPKQPIECTMEGEEVQKPQNSSQGIVKKNPQRFIQGRSISSHAVDQNVDVNPIPMIVVKESSLPSEQRVIDAGPGSIIQVENLNSYQRQQQPQIQPLRSSIRKSFTHEQQHNNSFGSGFHISHGGVGGGGALNAILEMPPVGAGSLHSGGGAGHHSPDRFNNSYTSVMRKINNNRYSLGERSIGSHHLDTHNIEEEFKQRLQQDHHMHIEEGYPEMESSQTFLNPLGVSVTETSPNFLQKKSIGHKQAGIKVEDIKEEDDENVAESRAFKKKASIKLNHSIDGIEHSNLQKQLSIVNKKNKEQYDTSNYSMNAFNPTNQRTSQHSPNSSMSQHTVKQAKEQHNLNHEEQPVLVVEQSVKDNGSLRGSIQLNDFYHLQIVRQHTQSNPVTDPIAVQSMFSERAQEAELSAIIMPVEGPILLNMSQEPVEDSSCPQAEVMNKGQHHFQQQQWMSPSNNDPLTLLAVESFESASSPVKQILIQNQLDGDEFKHQEMMQLASLNNEEEHRTARNQSPAEVQSESPDKLIRFEEAQQQQQDEFQENDDDQYFQQ